MQSNFEWLDLVMSTGETIHVEMVQNLAHGVHDGMKNDIRPRPTIHSHARIFASTGEIKLRQMQSIFEWLELVRSTQETIHIEMVQNLAHGCIMA
jgi:hypothetical protein